LGLSKRLCQIKLFSKTKKSKILKILNK